jgi:hypothetical protein
VKLSSAAACRTVAAMTGDVGAGSVAADDPDASDDMRLATEIMASSVITDVDRYEVVKVGRCHYTVDAETGGGRLVQVGPTVWARAATGGDGFRTALLIADQLADVVTRSGTVVYTGVPREAEVG